MTTARQKVLTYLMKSHTASVREIARALKMSAATVRHHLRILVADGRLEMESTRGHEGRGRPQKVFSIPRAALGDNLSALAEALLTEAGSRVKMEALAKRLAGNANIASQSITKRLSLTVERLNQMNYHARWEAGAKGPKIIFGHCPYAAIIKKHPELCNMDRQLLEELMGRSALQSAKIDEEESSTCIFATG